jgi:hypothetical protein
MQRSLWWTAIIITMTIVAPLAGLIAAPAAQAETSGPLPVATRDDEIVLLTATGQIRVDDPYTPAGYRPATWNSGAETGWTRVATGDFNGDGDAEIVAAKNDTIKVFDPFGQTGFAPVVFERTLGSGRNVSLLVTGDFDGDGKDEIAITHADTGTNIQETLKVYDGGASGTADQWTIAYTEQFNAQWVDMVAGDLNNDGGDDLSLVRNISQGGKLLKSYNGRTWAALAEQNYNFPWLALAAGNLSTDYAGDELALTRGGVLGQLDSLVLFRWVSGTYADVVANPNYKYYPYFTSVAVGDLNGDNDDEVVLLRDPTEAGRASLIVVNPAGVAMRAFELAIGYGSTAWKLVRTGDVDADGRDEIVVERGDAYWVYTAPELNDAYSPTTGSFYTTAAFGNLPTMAIGNIDGLGVLQGPVLNVSPTSQSFDLEYGQASPIKSFTITNTGTADVLSWQAQVVEGGAWLQLDRPNDVTPGALGVSVNTSAVVPGSYTGRIRLTATGGSGTVGNSPQDVTVTLTLRGVAMVVDPLSLSFAVSYGQTSPVKQVTIRSAGGASPIQWQADVLEGTAWLVLSATQGASPSTVNVSINTLAVTPGNHTGTIRIRALDSRVSQGVQYVAISLTVQDSGLVVTPQQLVIRQKAGGSPRTLNVEIVRPGWTVQWVATALPTAGAAELLEKLASGQAEVSAAGITLDGVAVPPPGWLSFTPDQGSTPTTMRVSVQTNVPGIYQAMIVIVAVDPNTPNRVRTVNVTGYVVSSVNYAPMVLKSR